MRTKLIRVILASSIVAVTIIGFTGCGKSDRVTKDKYEQVKSDITLGCGLTATDLEDNMGKFVYRVYNPQNEGDILKGLEIIKEITTESEYKDLVKMAKYDPKAVSNISNVKVNYAPKAKTSDNMERVYTEFTLETEDKYENIALEFVFNPNNKIFKHYTWKSVLVKSKNRR